MNVPSKNDFRLLIGAKLTNLKIFLKLRKYWLFSNHLFCLVTLGCTNIIHSCQNMGGGKIQICWKYWKPSFVKKSFLRTHSSMWFGKAMNSTKIIINTLLYIYSSILLGILQYFFEFYSGISTSMSSSRSRSFFSAQSTNSENRIWKNLAFINFWSTAIPYLPSAI